MPFLSAEDYKTLIKDPILAQVTGSQDIVRTEAELMAQQEMESYLNHRYDVVNIFNKTGDDRNPLIVMYLIDCVLYHIHARITPRNMPQVRVDRYNAAMMWLEKVADGKISPDLPVKEDGDGEQISPFRFGSNTKFNSEY